MLDSLRLYFDATLAVAIMAVAAILSGFVAAAATGDRTFVILTTIAGFVLTGAVLVFRLWRMTRKAALPLDPGA